MKALPNHIERIKEYCEKKILTEPQNEDIIRMESLIRYIENPESYNFRVDTLEKSGGEQ